ncbi:MAG: DUF3052 domain-containing protein, partial [Gammaproteobacteria bacterium]
SRVLVTAAPDGFDLGAPHHRRASRDPYDLVLLFCPELTSLHRRWPDALARTAVNGALWIAWPKRSSGVRTDLTEDVIRDFALPYGVVDVKVCAVDEVWSGLKLVRRLSNR